MGFLGTILLYAAIIALFLVFMGVVVSFVMAIMARREINRTSRETIERIMNVLPKEDCTLCGYASCEKYASAAVQGTIRYVPCAKCSEDMNARISLMWVNPKENENNGREEETQSRS